MSPPPLIVHRTQGWWWMTIVICLGVGAFLASIAAQADSAYDLTKAAAALFVCGGFVVHAAIRLLWRRPALLSSQNRGNRSH